MNQALREARQELSDYDRNRDLYERRDRIHHMTRIGMSETEVATVVGVSDRTVSRHKLKPAVQPRRLYNPDMAGEERMLELEQTAEFVLELAHILRDEDPTLAWGALCRLSERKLREATMVALAAIPTNHTKDELLHWVRNLGRQSCR